MKYFGIELGTVWTERDIIIALAGIWNCKINASDNFSIVLGCIFHSSNHKNFNREYWNALCKVGEQARKRAQYLANEKAWAAQDRRTLLIVKNLMWCMEQDLFANAWLSEKLAKQLCQKNIVGMVIENDIFKRLES